MVIVISNKDHIAFPGVKQESLKCFNIDVNPFSLLSFIEMLIMAFSHNSFSYIIPFVFHANKPRSRHHGIFRQLWKSFPAKLHAVEFCLWQKVFKVSGKILQCLILV